MDAPPADLFPNLVDVEALARDHAESACAGTAPGLGPGTAPGPGSMAPGPSPVSAPGPIPGQIPGPISGPISAPPQTPSGIDAKITFAPPSAEHIPGLTVDSDAIGRMFEEEQTRQAEALVAAPPPNGADPGMGSGVSGTEFSGLAPDACPPPPPDDVTDARRTLNDAANNLPFSKEMNETFMDALTAVAASASRSERTRVAPSEQSEPETNPGAERTPVESVAAAAAAEEEEEAARARERAKARAAEAAAEIAASSSASTTSVKAMFAARVAKEAVGSARGSEKAVGSASGPSGTETNGARKSTLPSSVEPKPTPHRVATSRMERTTPPPPGSGSGSTTPKDVADLSFKERLKMFNSV